VVIVAAGFALSEGNGGSAADQDSAYSQHPEDVKVVSCAESGGYAAAGVRVTNSSTDESTYALQISFQSPNGQTVYDTQTVIVPQLAAHKSSTVQQVRSAKSVGAQSVDCVVTRAARYGS
jgi:hypothetical protein